jgi:hypothetical protein
LQRVQRLPGLDKSSRASFRLRVPPRQKEQAEEQQSSDAQKEDQ